MADLVHFEILDQRVRVGKVTRKGIVICNGFKTRSHEEYLGKMVFLHELHDVFVGFLGDGSQFTHLPDN